MDYPLVSCLTATYGRPVVLGEAIKCFVDQDYPNKELIVLNDQEGVQLVIENCPQNIHIVNYPKRFGSLGEKRNHMTTLASGEFFCIWDDDDLYTPFRISDSIKYAYENPQYDIYKAEDAILCMNLADYKIANNLFHSQACIRKEYMSKNKYPNMSIGEDRDFEKHAKVYSAKIFPFIWYLYRWNSNLNIHHLSGLGDEKRSWDKALIFEPYSKLKGKVVVRPEFQKDYWADVKVYMNNINPAFGKLWYDKIGRKC